MLTPTKSHPIHPATVHWPIAFLSLAYGLDTIYGVQRYLNISLSLVSSLTTLPELGKAAHYIQALGIITAVPSIMTGVQQALKIYGNGGLYEADGKTIRAKMKMTIAHAALNDLVAVASIWSWWDKSTNVGNLPSGLNVLSSAMLFPILMYSANLVSSRSLFVLRWQCDADWTFLGRNSCLQPWHWPEHQD